MPDSQYSSDKKNMNRRAVFSQLLETFAKKREQITASLEPYDKPLTQKQVYHLLRRSTFGISYPVAQQLIGKSADYAVDWLLNNAVNFQPQEIPSWINDGFKSPFGMSEGDEKAATITKLLATTRQQSSELKLWWLKLMLQDTQSIREKTTLFWHGHFTSQYFIDGIMPAQVMYRQNILLRELHQGNFQTFLEKITIDQAMLIYLNGQDSTDGAPNENYARELLELFTMGIGNYSEQDIREIARTLTGWRTNYFLDNQDTQGLYVVYLNTTAHDFGSKSIFGETILRSDGVAGNGETVKDKVYRTDVKRLVEILISKKGTEIAKFMAKKMYTYWVYSNPTAIDQTIIDLLAKTLINNKFELKPVLAQLLKSKHFFDDANIGIQIKPPADTVISFTKHFSVTIQKQEKVMTQLGQEILNPPNVAGWKGYRSWITTNTLPLAIASLSSFLEEQSNESVANWAKQFPLYAKSAGLTQALVEFFLARSVETTSLLIYEKKLLGEAPDYEWSTIINNDVLAGQRIKVLIKELIKVPDFYLC